MIFRTDSWNLEMVVELDTEAEGLDLTANGLGDQILEAGVGGLVESHAAQVAPETGEDWPKLAPSTVRKKGHAVIGIDTGKSGILDPETWLNLPRDVQPRIAILSFPRGKLRQIARGWQLGQEERNVPARRLMGWTPLARQTARQLVSAALFRLEE